MRAPKFDARVVARALTPQQMRRIVEIALLLGYCEGAAHQVDLRRATAFAAGEAFALGALRRAVEGVPLIARVFRDMRGRPPRPDLSVFGVRSCRSCGCTDEHACAEGCWWVAKDLCSSCAGYSAESLLEELALRASEIPADELTHQHHEEHPDATRRR